MTGRDMVAVTVDITVDGTAYAGSATMPANVYDYDYDPEMRDRFRSHLRKGAASAAVDAMIDNRVRFDDETMFEHVMNAGEFSVSRYTLPYPEECDSLHTIGSRTFKCDHEKDHEGDHLFSEEDGDIAWPREEQQ